jgi:hypothetical protein
VRITLGILIGCVAAFVLGLVIQPGGIYGPPPTVSVHP